MGQKLWCSWCGETDEVPRLVPRYLKGVTTKDVGWRTINGVRYPPEKKRNIVLRWLHGSHTEKECWAEWENHFRKWQSETA